MGKVYCACKARILPLIAFAASRHIYNPPYPSPNKDFPLYLFAHLSLRAKVEVIMHEEKMFAETEVVEASGLPFERPASTERERLQKAGDALVAGEIATVLDRTRIARELVGV